MRKIAVMGQNGDVISFSDMYGIILTKNKYLIAADTGKEDSKYIVAEYSTEERAKKAIKQIYESVGIGENIYIMPEDEEIEAERVDNTNKYRRNCEDISVISQDGDYVITNAEVIYMTLDDYSDNSIYVTKYEDRYHVNIGKYKERNNCIEEMMNIAKKISEGKTMIEISKE